uniref:NADP-dependent oxidoreductase domain-containing protein n=1 Tax=Timema bartmani TaxID=61472 RepID=A0A7R9FCH0_9NEOP|nr:unnamed protein product [Timema bartmani]
MEQCVRLGYVRSLGLSNFNSQQVSRVLDVATIPPVTNQIECHPYLNQMVLAKICYKSDIVVTACSPLGAPSPVPGISGTPNLLNDNRLELLTIKYNKSAAQVVLRYMVSVQRGTVPLPKSEDKTHMIENMDIFDFELSESDMSYIDVFDSRSRFFPFTECVAHYS